LTWPPQVGWPRYGTHFDRSVPPQQQTCSKIAAKLHRGTASHNVKEGQVVSNCDVGAKGVR
jgi:hypothetical protein